MISIEINSQYDSFIDEYSKKLDLGGYSNLSKSDLQKSSRADFQKTGLFGEIAFYKWRYNSIDTLKSGIDKKLAHYKSTGLGDDGKDDIIVYNNKTRFVDIKTSHIESEHRIQYLNLIIPQREMHSNMIYVAAFSIGKDRQTVDNVVLAGWAFNEDVNKRWKIDPKKFCVPTKELRPMNELEEFIR